MELQLNDNVFLLTILW